MSYGIPYITSMRERERDRERERQCVHGLIPGGTRHFSLLLSITLALGHTQSPVKLVLGTLILGIKWQEH
jgi:hypothetical protein